MIIHFSAFARVAVIFVIFIGLSCSYQTSLDRGLEVLLGSLPTIGFFDAIDKDIETAL